MRAVRGRVSTPVGLPKGPRGLLRTAKHRQKQQKVVVSLQLREEKSLLRGSEECFVWWTFLMMLCSGSTESTLQADTYGRRHHQKEEEEKLR